MTKKIKKEEVQDVSKHLTNSEVAALADGLKLSSNVTGDSKFSYAIARTDSYFEGPIKAINKAKEESEEHKEYMQERKKLVLEYAVKDSEEKGSYKEANRFGTFKDVDVTDEAKLLRKIKELVDENQEVINTRKEQIKSFKRFSEERTEEEIKYHKLKDSNIPDELTVIQLYYTSFLLDLSFKATTPAKLSVRDILSYGGALQTVAKIKGDIVENIVFNFRSLKHTRDEVINNTDIITKFKEYQFNREDLIESLCGESYLGSPSISIVENVSLAYHYENPDKAKEAIDKFDEEHKDISDAYVDFLDKELEVKLKLIDIDDVPDEITPRQLKSILYMIKE